MDRDGRLGLLSIMAAAALWATVGVASRAVPASASLSDDLMGVARMAIGGPAILALAMLTGRARLGDVLRLNPRQLALFALGCAVFQISLFRAFAALGVTATVFLTVCLPPVLSMLWAIAVRGQRPGRGAAVALGLAVAGLAVFAAGMGRADAGASAGGLMLALVAALAFVVMTEAARSLTVAAGPLIVVGAGLSLAGLVLMPGLVLFGLRDAAPYGGADWQGIALVLYLGLGPTALAYVAYCHGVARCRSASVSLIASMVEPVLAALLAWIVLAERLSAGEVMGCAMLAVAMVVLWRAEAAARAGDANGTSTAA